MRRPSTRARGVPKGDFGMNKTEAAYSQHLEWRLQGGEILWYLFEGMKFRLAPKTFYTPDFAVMNVDGTIELHEVKGFWEDDARVKIKVAADMFPFLFVGVQRKGVTGWTFEEFGVGSAAG